MADAAESKIPSWLQSSVDPTKVSLMIKGATAFVPLFVTTASAFGWHVVPEVVTQIIDAAATAAAAVFTFWGLLRKLIVKSNDNPQ